MIRVGIISICIALAGQGAWADRVVLVNGQVHVGDVSGKGGTIYIKSAGGVLRVRRSDVETIETKAELIGLLEQMLSDSDQSDAEALFKAGKWASENGLLSQAEDIYTQILSLDVDHARARRALRYVKVYGKWYDFDEVLGLMSQRIAAGQVKKVPLTVFRELEVIAVGVNETLSVGELLGKAYLSAGQQANARKNFKLLADKARKLDSFKTPTALAAYRYDMIVSILQANPDGVYVLTETYPAKAALLGGSEKQDYLSPGPVWLGLPLALDAALRDCAMRQLDEGGEYFTQAKMGDSLGPEEKAVALDQARQAFDMAEALLPGVSRGRQVEVARLRIKTVRVTIDAEAREYDESEDALGEKLLSTEAYHVLLNDMIGKLGNVASELQLLLKIARPFSSELSGAIRWARTDLKTVRLKIEILKDELGGQ